MRASNSSEIPAVSSSASQSSSTETTAILPPSFVELAQEGLGDAVELDALCLKPLKDQIMHTDTDSLDGAGIRRGTASALAKRHASVWVTDEPPDTFVTGLAVYDAHIVAFRSKEANAFPVRIVAA